MADALRLYGLKAVVTAGASGIGEAVARTMAKHAATVLALDSEASGVETTYKSVRGVTGRAVNTDADGFGGAVLAAAKEVLGGLDIVVNYLELPQESPVGGDDGTQLDEMLGARDARYRSVVDATLAELKKGPAGKIINIGFVRSVFGADGEKSYERSQEQLHEFSKAIATEHGGEGIFANFIQPGAIMTHESRPVYSANTSLRDFCIRRSAAKRLGEPVDVAKVALFLATDDAGFVNGTGVLVDGGRADMA